MMMVCGLCGSDKHQNKTQLNGDKWSVAYVGVTRHQKKTELDGDKWSVAYVGVTRHQNKTELDGDKWSVAYVPLGATTHQKTSWMEPSGLWPMCSTVSWWLVAEWRCCRDAISGLVPSTPPDTVEQCSPGIGASSCRVCSWRAQAHEASEVAASDHGWTSSYHWPLGLPRSTLVAVY